MSRRRFDQLSERLLRGGIAPRHVRRLVEELGDHFDDLLREELGQGLARETAKDAARARLGSDDMLAEAILARPGLRSLTSRYPWAVFGFGPVLMLAAFVAVATLIEGGLLRAHIGAFRSLTGMQPIASDWLKFTVAAWNGFVIYAAPFAIAGILFVVGTRQRLASGWIILGIAIVCVLGGFHEIQMNWSDVPGGSELSVGFGISRSYPQIYRAIINVALAGAAYWWWLRGETSRAPE